MATTNPQIKKFMELLEKELRDNSYGTIECKASEPVLKKDGSFSLEISSKVVDESAGMLSKGSYPKNAVTKATITKKWKLSLDGEKFEQTEDDMNAESVAYLVAARARRKVGLKMI